MGCSMKKSLSLALAFLFAAVLALPGSSAGSKVVGAFSDYDSYEMHYQNTAPAKAAVELPILSAERSQNASVRDYLGKTAVCLAEGESLTWHFFIPEDARYKISLCYATVAGNGQDLKISLLADGEKLFQKTESLDLKRIWRDATGIKQDARGNDLVPKQEEVLAWRTVELFDDVGYSARAIALYFSMGEHTLTLSGIGGDLYLAEAALRPPTLLRPYAQVAEQWKQDGLEAPDGVELTYQAETTYQKSSQTIYPIYDRGGAATVPNDPSVVKRNTIGGSYWKKAGDWITYRVEAPMDGLYCLTFKYRQNAQLDMSVYRSLLINGEIQYAELENIAFPYAGGWQNLTLQDTDGRPLYIRLNKGENTITLRVTVGEWSQVLRETDAVASELNTLYRRIMMVTGVTPDTYRDYKLENEIDHLTETLATLSRRLKACVADFVAVNGKPSGQSAVLDTAADQLEIFAEKPAKIPNQLSAFRENITAISNWLQSTREQQLELDYFMVHSADAAIPRATGTFLQKLKFFIRQFLAAFSDEYGSIDDNAEQNAISIWINDGRDQAQLWKDMINDDFTDEYHIGVNVNLVSGGIIEAVLSGRAPDIVIGASRGQPINLASRGALTDLTQFSGYETVKNRFMSDALMPYTYRDGVYALPMTQYYFVMFYRTDIFKEFSLTPPDTWSDFLDAAAYLQRNNMKVGLPYTAISAVAAVDLGVGAKDLFPSLLLQNGGSYYNRDCSVSTLDSSAALSAFRTWTSFYTDYGFDLSYDLPSLFRSGEMPLAIATYTAYGLIDAVAPEIHGNWDMAVVPGTLQADGTVNRAGSASGSAVIMLKDAADKEACWKFMSWITDTAAQSDFGNRIEGQLGVSARYATANPAAFEQLNWTSEQKEILRRQRTFITETPEIPGGYYTSRCVDNAFRSVVYNRENTRKALTTQVETINIEIKRKIRELE